MDYVNIFALFWLVNSKRVLSWIWYRNYLHFLVSLDSLFYFLAFLFVSFLGNAKIFDIYSLRDINFVFVSQRCFNVSRRITINLLFITWKLLTTKSYYINFKSRYSKWWWWYVKIFIISYQNSRDAKIGKIVSQSFLNWWKTGTSLDFTLNCVRILASILITNFC